LAVVNNFGSSVSVLRGNGNGTFQTHVDYTVGEGAFSVAIGDLNGDSFPDLAVTGSPGVDILLNNGNGTFHSYSGYKTGFGNSSVVLADVDGDGRLDALVSNQYGFSVSVLLGDGDGTLAENVDYGAGPSPASAAIG